ncbi:MAG: ABC transporter permease subunit [Pseudomonadota bacterium]
MKRLFIGLPALWMAVFFLLPLAILAIISLGDVRLGQPPVAWGPDWPEETQLDLDSFDRILTRPLYVDAFISSLSIAVMTTLLALLIGYPMALGIATAPRRWRTLLLLLVILPFWTSFLLRVYAWMGLLGQNGPLNQLLVALGLIDDPIRLLNSNGAMLIGLVYTYLPFMILPLYANLARLDHSLAEAAQDLGARRIGVFLDVTLPMSVPGILAGSMLVFAPVIGEYVIPTLLGDARSPMIGRVLADEFFLNRDWPVTAALSIAILIVVAIPLFVLNRFLARSAERA